ncbi:unnamed protein product [Caenorhabditis angaria]|uniref:Uncharacterized protein n=1 Tax=Caenorhabditis angaria TaxID=860376 RepID=A0A9P1N1T6_9PELO|nr:unnamed protein product [Caenorhabditis angaria]
MVHLTKLCRFAFHNLDDAIPTRILSLGVLGVGINQLVEEKLWKTGSPGVSGGLFTSLVLELPELEVD